MPYFDPHAQAPYDYRTDPTVRENPPAFWLGYGRYREGVNYSGVEQTPDTIAGWCYGLSEGKRSKPLWESKSFYEGIAVIALSLWAGMNTEVIVNNPNAVAAIGTVIGVLQVVIRNVTSSAIAPGGRRLSR